MTGPPTPAEHPAPLRLGRDPAGDTPSPSAGFPAYIREKRV